VLVIIAIGGLPGVSKTTVARATAGRLRAAHLRIDAFEAALVTAGLVPSVAEVGAVGYGMALAAADTCLSAGWVRLVCGDLDEHRRRVEQRVADLPGHVVPDWGDVVSREDRTGTPGRPGLRRP
jgi:predicted kinase